MELKAIGYSALISEFNLQVLPHFRASYIALQGRGYVEVDQCQEKHIYPRSYALHEEKNPLQQLEFALKHEGVNLEIIKVCLEKIGSSKITEYIRQQPLGKYARIIWFLYEYLLEENLELVDCKRVKYVDVLDQEMYFSAPIIKSKRHAVNNNLLGNAQFCPMIRKTKLLINYINKNLDIKAKELIEKYDSQVIARASNYLYTKETMSSYAIEHEKPNQQRLSRFIAALQHLSSYSPLNKTNLVELQNIIVDSRFKDVDYRATQNYVGEYINQYLQKIHYISPKPEDVENLMSGLLFALDKSKRAGVHPVIIAAAIAFGFVFIHPFEDGNGRIHRFLIHYILSLQKFTPDEIIFPVSAIMLQNIRDYDEILELFSKPLLSKITNYTLTNDGVLFVKESTKTIYQYIDYTRIAEYLFSCIEATLNSHFQTELQFIVNYDKTKLAMQNVVDMPDKLIDLFIRCILQNNGMLSLAKKQRYFGMLTTEEINELSEIVCKNMQLNHG